MDRAERDPLDDTDVDLVRALARRARSEIGELAAGVGIPPVGVRRRIRSLERRGVLRGVHATGRPPVQGTRLLLALRFLGDRRPCAVDLCALAGVRRVHALSSGWDYVLEVTDGEAVTKGLRGAQRGSAWVLGGRAEFEVLPVIDDVPCPHGVPVSRVGRWRSGVEPCASSID